MSTPKRDAVHADEKSDQDLKHLENVDLHDKALNAGAMEATAAEHSVGFVEGFKTYKRAAFWSFSKSAHPSHAVTERTSR